ncbi:hypothetical protein E1B28_005203 [Marasmius oreades]|uniref:Protein kinase domain-containing protein n=1 Tax=Marasmius oreades TaxID=181124 RepID=A0A9P8AE27_9AGAR|nr:uncharacterized protein E1B28_005203 [Marasmius oreades]KAG7097890.1 hypothetical protein E1B28_005203 [Marasmius oreades]
MAPVPSNEILENLPDSNQVTKEGGQDVEFPAQNSERPVTPPQAAGQGTKSDKLHETPLKYSASSHNQCTSMHYQRDARYRQAEAENEGKFISMDPERFVDLFLPADPTKPFNHNDTAQKNFENAANCSREKESYPFLSKAFSAYCPSLEIINTSKHPTTVIWGRQEVEIKPDISAYLKGGRATGEDSAVDIDKVEVMIEGKWTISDDAFDDTGKSFERNSGQGKDTRGQITAYAAAQLARQHRTHCFSVLFVKDSARLIRWDRAGAIATKKFNFVKEHWLAMFFHRYNFASPSTRGVDTSVERLLSTDPLAKEAREALGTQSNEALHKFKIVDDETGVITYYIGSKPLFNFGSSFTGRCTRCYKVYDIKREKIVFMKDTWRVDAKDVTKEGEVYRLLKERGVPNILTLVTYGDVRHQDNSTQPTQTQHFRQMRGHCHARLVFEEIGRDLTHFNTTGEIVSAIKDAIKAHKGAYEDARIMHRDVSVGNILILDNGKGVLIDWDLSKSLDKKGTPRQNQRTGTWQFMSAKLLADPSAPIHELADDLESFYHVLVWVVLKFTPHPLHKHFLMHLLQTRFDETIPRTGQVPVGGGQKALHFESSYMQNTSQLPQGELRNLIVDLEAVLRIRYAKPTKAETEALELWEGLYSEGSIDEQKYRSQKHANYAWQHSQYAERLTSHAWMLSRFRQTASLKDRMLDQRVVHDVTPSNQSEQETRVRKRSSELESEDPPPAQRRRLDRAAKSVVGGYSDDPNPEDEEDSPMKDDHDTDYKP